MAERDWAKEGLTLAEARAALKADRRPTTDQVCDLVEAVRSLQFAVRSSLEGRADRIGLALDGIFAALDSVGLLKASHLKDPGGWSFLDVKLMEQLAHEFQLVRWERAIVDDFASMLIASWLDPLNDSLREHVALEEMAEAQARTEKPPGYWVEASGADLARFNDVSNRGKYLESQEAIGRIEVDRSDPRRIRLHLTDPEEHEQFRVYPKGKRGRPGRGGS